VNVRILAGVPHIYSPAEEKKRRTRQVLEWGCASVMLMVMLAANVYTSLGR